MSRAPPRANPRGVVAAARRARPGHGHGAARPTRRSRAPPAIGPRPWHRPLRPVAAARRPRSGHSHGIARSDPDSPARYRRRPSLDGACVLAGTLPASRLRIAARGISPARGGLPGWIPCCPVQECAGRATGALACQSSGAWPPPTVRGALRTPSCLVGARHARDTHATRLRRYPHPGAWCAAWGERSRDPPATGAWGSDRACPCGPPRTHRARIPPDPA